MIRYLSVNIMQGQLAHCTLRKHFAVVPYFPQLLKQHQYPCNFWESPVYPRINCSWHALCTDFKTAHLFITLVFPLRLIVSHLPRPGCKFIYQAWDKALLAVWEWLVRRCVVAGLVVPRRRRWKWGWWVHNCRRAFIIILYSIIHFRDYRTGCIIG